MKVFVVGAGQMGALYGAAAHDNGHSVFFIDTNRELVDAINERGLRIDQPSGESIVYSVKAGVDASESGGTPDVLLFMVKGWATAPAAARVASAVHPTTAVVTLQNGLGNEEALRAAFPTNPLYIGVSVHTVITVGAGHYSLTGVRSTYLGPAAGGELELAQSVARVFERPGAPVHALPEAGIREEQWGKFVLNCASLPTMALTRLPTSVAADVPVVFEHMDNVTRETCEIAHAEGIGLDTEERVAFQRDLFRTAGGRASMLGDVLAERRTEIDTINGAAVRFADKHGLPAPLNRALFALVKGLEESFDLPDTGG